MSFPQEMRLYLLIWAIFSAVPTIVCYTGSIEADSKEASHQVSLHLSYNDEFLCGGAIVSPSEVVTVADRLYYSWGGVLPKIVIRIRAGRRSLEDSAYQEFEVEEVLFHPDFDKKTMENNVAVLQTEGRFEFFDPDEGISVEKVLTNTVCSVIGWNQESLDLRILDVHIIECGSVFAMYSGDICVRTADGTDTLCRMSEGSSLSCNSRLVGLLSIQPSCNSTEQTAVFGSISLASALLEANLTSSASADDIVARPFRIMNVVTAAFYFLFGVLF